MNAASPISRDALVVVFGDPSRPAIARALEQAGAQGSATLTSVVGAVPASQADLEVAGTGRHITELLVEARSRLLQEHAAALGEGVGVRVEPGDVRTVIEAFRAHGHDCVVVVGERTPEARLAIARLIELCPGPVVIEARPGIEPGPNVLAAIDPEADLDLNQEIVASAIGEARRTRGEVHLVHTWAVAGEDDLRISPHVDVPEADLASYALAVEEAHRVAFDRVLEALHPPRGDDGEPRVTPHLVHGTPADAVARLAARERVGLVVTGTDGRATIEKALTGSAARLIAEGDDHATLVLKADDFASPLD